MAENMGEKYGPPPNYTESVDHKQPILHGQQQPPLYPVQQPQGYPMQYQQHPQYPVQNQTPPYVQQPNAYSQQNVMFVPPQHVYANEPEPDSHKAFAILTMLFCCFPLGLVALIKSSEVSSAYAMGDMTRARMASNDARKYSQISLGFGILNWIGVVIFMIVYFAFVIPNLSMSSYN